MLTELRRDGRLDIILSAIRALLDATEQEFRTFLTQNIVVGPKELASIQFYQGRLAAYSNTLVVLRTLAERPPTRSAGAQ